MPHRKRRRQLPLSRLFPSFVTLLGLCIGLTSIRYALDERWTPAAIAILVAGVMDGVDGRVARMLRASSPFGAQLDSLADIINFGVAPAIVLYIWTLQDIGRLGWAAVLIYTVCCVIRLARFNTGMLAEDHGEEPKPFANKFFVGIPAPVGAALSIVFMLLSFEVNLPWLHNPYVIGCWLLLVAALMASRIPTISLKRLIIKTEHALPLLLGVGVLITLLVIEPWFTLNIIAILYLGSMPFTARHYKKLEREYAEQPTIQPISRQETIASE